VTAIDKSELDAIRARAEAATPGPWRVFVDGILEGVSGANGLLEVAEPGDLRVDDARFVAHARSDVPRLLAAIDTLEQVRAGLAAQLDAVRAALKDHPAAFTPRDLVDALAASPADVLRARDAEKWAEGFMATPGASNPYSDKGGVL
jgi:hypothetical protein